MFWIFMIVKILVLCRWVVMFFIVGSWYFFFCMVWLRFLGLRYICSFLFFFGIVIMEFIYLVGVVIWVMIFCVFKVFKVFLSWGFNVIEMWCGVCCMGGIVLFNLIVYWFLSCLRFLLKIFGNLSINFFLVIGESWFFMV